MTCGTDAACCHIATPASHEAPLNFQMNLAKHRGCSHHSTSFLYSQDMSEGLRYAFQTDSKYTLMVSGTGHAGMEAAIANLLEPGEKIIVGNAGIWGERVADLSARYGGE